MKIFPRYSRVLVIGLMVCFFCSLGCFPGGLAPVYAQALNPLPPPTAQRLVFIHHSVGENWLNPDPDPEAVYAGNLFPALNANNYFVSDTNYDWGPVDPDLGDFIGSHTDIGNWYNWFLGPQHPTNLPPLYAQAVMFTDPSWVNSMPNPDPGGENRIIMFKSCYPNSGGISGNPSDPPRVSSVADPNPLWGYSSGEGDRMTVTNIKGLYRDLLSYFATRQNKLFILITPPPVIPGEEPVGGSSDRARAINTWLVRHWLDRYPYNNVAVFDFFNVLTSNGGDPVHNDLGAASGNHHRLLNGRVQHIVQTTNNYTAYSSGDSHPTAAGGKKASGEFLPLLNVVYHAWQGTGGRPWFMGRSPLSPAATQLLLLN